ncbi:hypothetical protein IHE45_08G109900 [Dioscorea alata]|uniref:Uncharacterized protein n=1 Tax=Dioscorea alata TaxID=55571 RepID=A0ACB7VLL2_DIOAL|nr:hypothetical protein IHE45_08G109900 [Dioscorea alata]
MSRSIPLNANPDALLFSLSSFSSSSRRRLWSFRRRSVLPLSFDLATVRYVNALETPSDSGELLHFPGIFSISSSDTTWKPL